MSGWLKRSPRRSCCDGRSIQCRVPSGPQDGRGLPEEGIRGGLRRSARLPARVSRGSACQEGRRGEGDRGQVTVLAGGGTEDQGVGAGRRLETRMESRSAARGRAGEAGLARRRTSLRSRTRAAEVAGGREGADIGHVRGGPGARLVRLRGPRLGCWWPIRTTRIRRSTVPDTSWTGRSSWGSSPGKSTVIWSRRGDTETQSCTGSATATSVTRW